MFRLKIPVSLFCLIGMIGFSIGGLNVHAMPQSSSEKYMWVYFDLGNTVISTKDAKHLHYFPGAREYMHLLHRAGFKIGAIVNIPEGWGTNYPQKLQALKNVLAQDWAEQKPFEWEAFDQVILPMKDTERKPAPTLYIKAIENANGCPSAFIGEDPAETNAAINLGMAAKLFVENDPELYIHPLKVRDFLLRNYKRPYDPRCLIQRSSR